MHRILMRFKIVKTGRIVEAYLDRRLSFYDNFILLEKMLDERIAGYRVFDQNKGIFLDMNIPIEEFDIKTFMYFYLL